MTDTNQQLAALQAQLAALQQPQQPAMQPGGFGGFQQFSAQPAPAMVAGVSVPAKIETQHGTLRVYFHLPAEVCQTPQALMAAIDALAAAGVPLDAWQSRDQGGGYGGRSNYGGGGYGNSGGYNRGGYRR